MRGLNEVNKYLINSHKPYKYRTNVEKKFRVAKVAKVGIHFYLTKSNINFWVA
jgi:hypothetical protein